MSFQSHSLWHPVSVFARHLPLPLYIQLQNGRDFGFLLHNQHGALLTTKQCGPEVGALGFGLPSVQRNDQKNMSASAQFGLGPVRGRGVVLTRWRCLAPSSPPSCPGPGARGRAPCCGLSPICAHLQASLPSRAGPRSYKWSLRGQEPDPGNVEPPPRLSLNNNSKCPHVGDSPRPSHASWTARQRIRGEL